MTFDPWPFFKVICPPEYWLLLKYLITFCVLRKGLGWYVVMSMSGCVSNISLVPVIKVTVKVTLKMVIFCVFTITLQPSKVCSWSFTQVYAVLFATSKFYRKMSSTFLRANGRASCNPSMPYLGRYIYLIKSIPRGMCYKMLAYFLFLQLWPMFYYCIITR